MTKGTRYLFVTFCLKKVPGTFCVDLAGLFGDSNPVEIEIGCGRGKFLVARASECPGINFLGIDRVERWMKIAKEKSFKNKIENLKFIKDDARVILERLRSGTVSAFHIYFPDPWPKRRHRKRRLVSDGLLRLLHAGLIPDGLIEIATDDLDYFTEIKKAAAETEISWKQIRESVNERMNFPSLKTNYELKYESAGKNIYYLELQK